MCAQWERHTSRTFHVCNGVKQGAVISPILFAIYYDKLIANLASRGYSVPVNQLDNLFLLILLYSIVPTLWRTNK